MKQEKQSKKEKKPFQIAVVVLSILLALSVAGYGFVFFVNEKHRADITLGDQLTIATVSNGSATGYIIYPSIALPGVEYSQSISFNVTEYSFLRAKVVCVHDDEVELVKITTNDDWLAGEDGYWYYVGEMKNIIDFTQSIVLPSALSDQRQSNIISVVVESIVDIDNALDVWQTAPSEWGKN